MKSMLLPGAACLLAAAIASGAPAQTVAEDAAAPAREAAAFVATPADAATLDAHRGGSQLAYSAMTLEGATADNSARHVVTGTNTIDGGAFANMSGLPVVIQNSGANVLIQNATIVHVEMH